MRQILLFLTLVLLVTSSVVAEEILPIGMIRVTDSDWSSTKLRFILNFIREFGNQGMNETVYSGELRP